MDINKSPYSRFFEKEDEYVFTKKETLDFVRRYSHFILNNQQELSDRERLSMKLLQWIPRFNLIFVFFYVLVFKKSYSNSTKTRKILLYSVPIATTIYSNYFSTKYANGIIMNNYIKEFHGLSKGEVKEKLSLMEKSMNVYKSN